LLNRSNQPEFQLLIVVSKKIFKKANKRNRLRRKISAVFEDLLAKNRLPPYTTCVVQVIKKDLLLAKPDEIQTEIIPEISKLYLQMTQAKQKNPTKNQPS
jgi:ribonuclease P protein component